LVYSGGKCVVGEISVVYCDSGCDVVSPSWCEREVTTDSGIYSSVLL